ncbi:hypothetical protein V8F06_006389 [Rhypophila decipiens]
MCSWQGPGSIPVFVCLAILYLDFLPLILLSFTNSSHISKMIEIPGIQECRRISENDAWEANCSIPFSNEGAVS